MATTFSSVVFDNSIRRVFAHGFMPKGTDKWATSTVRYHDIAMRYFTAELAATEIAFEGLTLISRKYATNCFQSWRNSYRSRYYGGNCYDFEGITFEPVLYKMSPRLVRIVKRRSGNGFTVQHPSSFLHPMELRENGDK